MTFSSNIHSITLQAALTAENDTSLAPWFALCLILFCLAQPAELRAAGYVGSETCQGCHQAAYEAWQGSHHAQAMLPALPEHVLGDFDQVVFEHQGQRSEFFTRDDAFHVRTLGPEGEADFPIAFTFGIEPLQQYLIALPGGRLQALDIAWDGRPEELGGQRWFHLYPDEDYEPGDDLHWTGAELNWNFQCASCHTTGLNKGYALDSRSYETQWAEPGVGCEACHGPGSEHLSQVAGDFPPDAHWGLVPQTMEQCAACHSLREQLSDIDASTPFLDAFRPVLLSLPHFYPDGQQKEEVFTYASFLQSRMYAEGVRCGDCHEPHSATLLVSGNALCLGCHEAGFDSPQHHFHVSGEVGSDCVDCHMPATVYMGVDARRDHSFRLPRPDRSLSLGVPNACGQCHESEGAVWAQARIEEYYPAPAPGFQDFAEHFALADSSSPDARDALVALVQDGSAPAIVRATAMQHLQRWSAPAVAQVAAGMLNSEEPLLRAAAAEWADLHEQRARLALLGPLLDDEYRLVRMIAGRALAGQSVDTAQGDALSRAMSEYEQAQRYNADRPESLVNLGRLYQAQGQAGEARGVFSDALALSPGFAPAAIALAELLRQQGGEASAEGILRSALRDNPQDASLEHALGLSLVRQQRRAEALGHLAQAAGLAPENPRYAYVHAVALHDSGEQEEALAQLERAVVDHPWQADLRLALLSYYLASQRLEQARPHLRQLLQLHPEDERLQALAGRLLAP